MVTTRRKILFLLRKHPGVTVSELASELHLTGMAVRRHMEALASEGVVVPTEPDRRGIGRPPVGWKLSATGLELFPRRYDALALDILEDLSQHSGPEAVDALLRRRNEKLIGDYGDALEGNAELGDKVEAVTQLRDDAGYVAEYERHHDGELVLTENNCAVHRVAERYPSVCALELEMLQRLFGPEVDVVRQSHTMAGDAVCAYLISRRERGTG